MTDKKIRLFLAANLGLATTRKIADALGKMRAVAERRGLRVGWVPPANLHVTLKFLGWSMTDVVEAVRDRVTAVAEGQTAFEVTARGAGGFPTDASARVLWVGVHDPSDGLGRLARGLEQAMAGLGFAPENRPFHPHVTVGRVKEGRGTDEVLAPWHKTEFGTSWVREIVLYESIMKSSGSEYIAQFRASLPAGLRQTREVEREPPESEESDGGQQPA
jgi:2'-5' RNA ligase